MCNKVIKLLATLSGGGKTGKAGYRQHRPILLCLTFSFLLHAIGIWLPLLRGANLAPASHGESGSPISATLIVHANKERQESATDNAPAALTHAMEPLPQKIPAPSAQVGGVLQAEAAQPATTTQSSPSESTYYINGIAIGPWYYAARYLHQRPTPRKEVVVPLPPFSEGVAGKVEILLFINQNGWVDFFKLNSATPSGLFDEAVINAFTKVQYRPGKITDIPVKSQLLLEVTFSADGSITTEFSSPENIFVPSR